MNWLGAIGISVCLALVLFGLNETQLSSLEAGSGSTVLRVGDCRNPTLIAFGRQWTTTDVVSTELQFGDTSRGTFSFNGDNGQFVGDDDIVLDYRTRVWQTNCLIE